jgi:hypothetical protein
MKKAVCGTGRFLRYTFCVIRRRLSQLMLFLALPYGGVCCSLLFLFLFLMTISMPQYVKLSKGCRSPETSYTPSCMELALKTQKKSHGFHIRSSLAVYNEIIVLRRKFVNSFSEI